MSPGVFFFFFKILIFRAFRGVKRQKMVQNDKKLCPSRFISQELYIIWLSFMLHMYKMIISLGFFFFFFFFNFFIILIFQVFRGEGKKEKKGPKRQKIVFHASYLRNDTSYDYHLWYTCVKWFVNGFFSFLQKFDFSTC